MVLQWKGEAFAGLLPVIREVLHPFALQEYWFCRVKVAELVVGCGLFR